MGQQRFMRLLSESQRTRFSDQWFGSKRIRRSFSLGFSMVSAFIAEVLLTFIFLLVIHGSTSEKVPKGFAGIPIGLSLVLIHLVGIPITGTSVNPARSLGPALISWWHCVKSALAFLGGSDNWGASSSSSVEIHRVVFDKVHLRFALSSSLFFVC